MLNELPLESPPIPITTGMAKKLIPKTKSDKAADPSGKVVEMIRATSDTGATMIRDYAIGINHDWKVPTIWEQSCVVCLDQAEPSVLAAQ